MYVQVYLQDETSDDTPIVVPKEPKTVTNGRLYENFDKGISLDVRSLVQTIRGYTLSGNVRDDRRKIEKTCGTWWKNFPLGFSIMCQQSRCTQFLRITENYKMADVSVPRNDEKLCSSNAQCTNRRKTLELTFQGRNKDW